VNILKKFSKQPIKTHLVAISFVSLITFLLVLGLSYVRVSRTFVDYLSANVYLVATLLTLHTLFSKRREPNRWKIWLLLLVVVFAFFEESEYLSELGYLDDVVHISFRPSFVETYFESIGEKNIHRHSLHNMIEAILVPWFQANVHPSLLSQASNHLKSVFEISVLFLLTLRLLKLTVFDHALMFFFSVSFLINGILASYQLYRLPTYENNVGLLNISSVRLLLIMGMLLFAALPIIFHVLRVKVSDRLRKQIFPLSIYFSGRTCFIIALPMSFTMLFLQISLVTTLSPISFEFSQRLTPLIVFLVGSSVLIIMNYLANIKVFSQSASDYIHALERLHQNYPSLIYMGGYGLSAIILAQLVDLNILFSSIANSHALIEEVLEFAGGLMLVIAALIIRYQSAQEQTLML
jgi:hypothetical protein